MYISRGSVATQLKCVRHLIITVFANFSQSLLVKC